MLLQPPRSWHVHQREQHDLRRVGPVDRSRDRAKKRRTEVADRCDAKGGHHKRLQFICAARGSVSEYGSHKKLTDARAEHEEFVQRIQGFCVLARCHASDEILWEYRILRCHGSAHRSVEEEDLVECR